MRSLVGLLAHLPGKVAVFILLCGLSGAFAHAADDASEYAFPESFKIRVSSFHIFNADSDIAVFGSSGVGASIDFDKDLGGENDITVPRIDGYYRFNQHHRIDYTVFRTDRAGSETLDLDITLGDESFSIGDRIDTEIEFDNYRLGYGYSFYHSPKVELIVTVGLSVSRYDFSFALADGGKSGDVGATAVLPTYGLRMAYRIDSHWSLQFVSETFFIDVDDKFKGTLLNYEFDLEYQFANNILLGAGISRISADLDVDTSDWEGRLADSNRGILLYVGYYF